MKIKHKIVNKANELTESIEKHLFRVSAFILVLFLFVLIISVGTSFSINATVNEKVQESIEYAKPSQLQISVINCNGCSDVLGVIDSIKKQNVEITNEEELSIYEDRAKELIDKYNIQNLPAVLIFGEINNNKTTFSNFEQIDDAMILNKITPPYLDIVKNELVGVVSIVEIVDSSCEACVDLGFLTDSLAQSGVSIGDWDEIEYNSEEGKAIIEKYNVGTVPVVLISKDIDEYDGMKDAFAQLTSINDDEFYIINSVFPPYRNLTTEKIVGMVDLIMLTDESCSECYNVSTNKQILLQLGIIPQSEETFDVSSSYGQQLIQKYGIEEVPMIIVSPEAEVYSSFIDAWDFVGSIEDDGWFVMRKPELIGETISII